MQRSRRLYALAAFTLFALSLVMVQSSFADITVQPLGKPDLIVSEAIYNQTIGGRYASAIIKNKGNWNSAACKLRFRINMPIDTYGNTTVVYISFINIPALASGQEYTISNINLGAYTYKGCGYDFMIDWGKVVTEKDEGNNYNLYIFP